MSLKNKLTWEVRWVIILLHMIWEKKVCTGAIRSYYLDIFWLLLGDYYPKLINKCFQAKACCILLMLESGALTPSICETIGKILILSLQCFFCSRKDYRKRNLNNLFSKAARPSVAYKIDCYLVKIRRKSAKAQLFYANVVPAYVKTVAE